MTSKKTTSKATDPTESKAGKAVAKRGVIIGSAHANRGTDSGRFPEEARRSAQRTVRAAMRRAD